MKIREFLISQMMLLTAHFGFSQTACTIDLERFNEQGAEFIARQSFDLYPLNAREKCIFLRTMLTQLDSINRTSFYLHHNRFVIRNYELDYFNLDANLLFDCLENRFYLLSLPHLSNYIYYSNDYYIEDQKTQKIRGDSLKLIRLNSELFDTFFERESFRLRGVDHYEFRDKLVIAKEVVNESLKSLRTFEVFSQDFRLHLEAQYKKKEISESDFRAMKEAFFSVDGGSVQTFRLVNIGYFITHYSKDKANNRISVKFYIWPVAERPVLNFLRGEADLRELGCNKINN